MKILIILNEPYPIGMACTKRIHLYAKGFTELGNNVKIIIPKRTESNTINNYKVKGKFYGVKYEYASKSTIRSKSFFGRRIHNILSYFKTVFLSINFKPNIILFVSNSLISILFIKFVCIITKAKFIREKSEVPYYWKKKLDFFEDIKIKFFFSLFDGIIVISDNLKKFFEKDYSIKTKFIKIPILINNNNYVFKEDSTNNNLVYTGSLSQHKDGIITIIKSFSKIVKNYDSLKLVMTGDLNSSSDKYKILKIIEDCNLEDKVIFTGYISEKELFELTHTAKVLVLAKPDNRQNKYNAATKIGEYLLTGSTVLITNVDPTCDYLKNRESAFIAEPNEKSFSKELEYIINNSEHANSVGEKGRLIALEYFDYIRHTKRIIKFIQEI